MTDRDTIPAVSFPGKPRGDDAPITTEQLLNVQQPSGPSVMAQHYRSLHPAPLTDAEHLTNAETFRHILTIRALLMEAIRELVNRADAHDVSKLGPPEVDTFTRMTPILAGLTYGSDEYKAALATMDVALQNHYAHNKHHPEHWVNGIADMDLFDILEMLIDWKAATLRHRNGDIVKSLEINTKRFNIPEPVRKLLGNTLAKIDEMAKRSRVAVSYPHVG